MPDLSIESEIAIPAPVARGAADLVREAGSDLESVLYYLHPFSVCGLVVVVSDRATCFPGLLARIHRSLPPRLSLHSLRRRELFHLALPGVSSPPHLDEQPHLAHCAKLRSALLHGCDCRPEIPLPSRPGLFLRSRLRGCRNHFRTHVILGLLWKRDYRRLIQALLDEGRHLLSVALMGAGGWRLDLAEAPARFAEVYGEEEAWRRLEDLAVRSRSAAADLRTEALDACWLFEQLLRSLEERCPL
ncbi:MAG TPA: hypothetical protein VHC97_24170 [Thermoanaerobaculia bacterium]|nr:hypothetical protein [Thermoanaerobaculia bacterium]